mgnify:CR=1 FL=1
MKQKHIVAQVKAVKENGTITGAIGSSQTVDRDNDILVQTGWELENFKKSPVLLWSHDPWSLPVGTVTDIKVQDGQLVFDAKFATFDEFGNRVWEMVKNGMLTSFSVGFVPKMQDNDGRITQMELLEISVVNIPANTEARITDSAKLEMVKSFRQAEKKFIGEKAGRVLSEANRSLIKGAMDSIDLSIDTLKNARTAFGDLLDATNADDPTKQIAPTAPVKKLALKTIPPAERSTVKTLRVIDKAVGILLQGMKQKHSVKGGDMK